MVPKHRNRLLDYWTEVSRLDVVIPRLGVVIPSLGVAIPTLCAFLDFGAHRARPFRWRDFAI